MSPLAASFRSSESSGSLPELDEKTFAVWDAKGLRFTGEGHQYFKGAKFSVRRR
jgi:hypothetical protein